MKPKRYYYALLWIGKSENVVRFRAKRRRDYLIKTCEDGILASFYHIKALGWREARRLRSRHTQITGKQGKWSTELVSGIFNCDVWR